MALVSTRRGPRQFPLRPYTLKEYARVCGEVLAKAHARTGDAAILYGYCGDTNRLDRAIGRFAITYADQTESDHAAFVKAIKVGKIRARRGI